MKKVYRISVFNRARGTRELMWEEFTSRNKAQEYADRMNACDHDNVVDAKVVVKER